MWCSYIIVKVLLLFVNWPIKIRQLGYWPRGFSGAVLGYGLTASVFLGG